jgi:hypothetical protein
MLEGLVALLLLQEVVQKAAPAPPPAASAEVVGKAQTAPAPAPAAAPASCVELPDPTYRGAAALRWYGDGETVTIGKRSYAKYGLPRVLGPGEVVLHATARGAPFYRVPDVAEPEILYLLTDPAGCEFQPYAVQG